MDDRRNLLDKSLLSILSFLELHDACNIVDLVIADGVMSHELLLWEKRNFPHRLPKDLKEFYSVFNGFNICWSVDLFEKPTVVGCLHINKLEEISPFLLDGYFLDGYSKELSSINPNEISACRCFSLCTKDEYGEIVLMFNKVDKESDPLEAEESEVWLVDITGRYFFVCSSFTQFLRLMVVHAGIHGWPLAFTPQGIPPTTEQWMSYFCRERLSVDKHWFQEQLSQSQQNLIDLS